MKKTASLLAALCLAFTASAQEIYMPGEHNNILSVAVDDAHDSLDKYPINLTLSNPTTPICSVSAYFYIDDNSIRPWLYDEDEEEYVYDANNNRCHKNIPIKLFLTEETNPSYPGYFYINPYDDKNFKLTEGTILTFYIDATLLSQGEHTLHIVEPMASYVGDDFSSASYFSDEQNIVFRIGNGELTIVDGISQIDSSLHLPYSYDLQGRKTHTTHQHGIYIKGDRKIIR